MFLTPALESLIRLSGNVGIGPFISSGTTRNSWCTEIMKSYVALNTFCWQVQVLPHKMFVTSALEPVIRWTWNLVSVWVDSIRNTGNN
jgi:hypothetical protein